jgi:hypothetical protein
MLGRPVISNYDGRELRAEAVQILQSGFKAKRLIAAPAGKRKATVVEQHDLGVRSKRQKRGGEKEATG